MSKQEVVKGSRLIPIIMLITFSVIFVAFASKESAPTRSELKQSANASLMDSWPGDGWSDISWTDIELTDIGEILITAAQGFTKDFPELLWFQLELIGVLILFSIIPGVFGMIYRRAFGIWFALSFVSLYALNWLLHIGPHSSIGSDILGNLELTESLPLFLAIEVVIVQLLLVFRLRRYSIVKLDAKSKRNNIMLGIGIILLAGGWLLRSINGHSPVVWWEAGSISVLLVIALNIIYQSLASNTAQGTRPKNILLCLDGTWNQPGTLDYGQLAETNVFKLFNMAKGNPASRRYNANQCKEYLGQEADQGECLKQISFYYHGVGNTTENSQLGQIFGGVFGLGASAIVERAYLDVLRVYRPGDRIFIFGFSRGAAIARLLAGVIDRRDTPTSLWMLRLFGRHWSVWKSFDRKVESEPVKVNVLGCWDTVGSFGIPKNIMGIPFQKVNLLKDLTVPLCVERAYHMVALDETRDSFEPTLMDLDPITPARIIEVWFSGNHSNVGGGYATDRLSNLTLDFLLRRISSGYALAPDDIVGAETWGLYLNARLQVEGDTKQPDDICVVNPDPRGRLRHSTGAAYTHMPRGLPIHAVIHDSVFERMKDVLPVYAPQSLFNLNDELVNKRAAIKQEVSHLSLTGSVSDDEAEKILNWSQQKLTLTKWSEYQELQLEDKSRMKDHLNTDQELGNSALQ